MITFDEVLLNPYYSAIAEGGPEWATDIQRSGLGGAVSARNQNREDFISKYEINYSEMPDAERRELRDFAIMRRGMSRGFRFLAPDDSRLERETVGIFNNVANDIVPLGQTNGSTTKFFVAKNYKSGTDSYLRWISKPSPLQEMTLEIFDATDPLNPVATATFAAGYNVFGQIPSGREVNIAGFGKAWIYYAFGIITFETAPPAGKIIKLTGQYHLPAAFTSDWAKFRVDETAISDFAIGVEEILPAELGISPTSTLPILPDETPPGIPMNLTATPVSSNQINLSWQPAIDNTGVTGYEIEVSY